MLETRKTNPASTGPPEPELDLELRKSCCCSKSQLNQKHTLSVWYIVVIDAEPNRNSLHILYSTWWFYLWIPHERVQNSVSNFISKNLFYTISFEWSETLEWNLSLHFYTVYICYIYTCWCMGTHTYMVSRANLAPEWSLFPRGLHPWRGV